jgi:hypothetical protein
MWHDLLSALIDLLTWLLRSFVDLGNVKLLGIDWSAVVYLFGVLPLPFAAARQWRAGRWPLALVLTTMTVYFVHNRLTLFSTVQITRASLLGNLALLALGLLFCLPIEMWAGTRKKESGHGVWHNH